MPVSRVYQNSPLALGAFKLSEDAAHHLARVLRIKTGDEVTIFNGQGGEYLAVVTNISKKGVDVEIKEFIDRDVESPVQLVLAQGISRGEKMDYVIQKAVELGVSEIYPLQTERCNVKLNDERMKKRLVHWQAVIVSACEQSGRNRLPIIHEPMGVSTWLEECDADLKLVLAPHLSKKLSELGAEPKKIAALIGPEGGLSDKEIEQALGQGCQPLNIGPRVLRTETAAVAALTILQFAYGDLS